VRRPSSLPAIALLLEEFSLVINPFLSPLSFALI